VSAANTAVAVSFFATIGGVIVWSFLSQPDQPPSVDQPVERRGEEPPPPSRSAVTQPSPSAPEEEVQMLKLPDGSEVAPLNGVKQPAAMVWQNPQWSPIVGTEHSNGIDWYVHADGTRTTTVMLWRSDLGRTDAITWSFHPREAVPTAPLPPATSPAGRK